ncbi:toll/interleukin-1 receptor domain-containing protein [Streptomyces sp. NPDC001073]
MTTKPCDFFISYTAVDRDWAAWTNDVLEEAGYTTVVQLLDFSAGSNFVTDMDEALINAERLILILSPAYLQSGMARAEWTAVFRKDPDGTRRLIIPVLVEPTDVDGLLGPRTYISVHGLDEDTARAHVVSGLQPARSHPRTRAPFPGNR